jgi:hypothetical protein
MLIRKNTSQLLLAFVAICFSAFCLAEGSSNSQDTSWLSQVDNYSKIVGGVLTGLGTLFGLPLAILHFKKTKAEIRKLELEASSIQQAKPADTTAGSYHINIEGHDNAVQILADPRFLGPLLLLLDFIAAWVILTLLGYATGLFIHGPLRTLLILLVASALLVPIYKEARRVRGQLMPKEEQGDS